MGRLYSYMAGKLTDQYCDENVDLCTECYKKFVNFMKSNTGNDKNEKAENMLEAFRKDVENACNAGELKKAISSIDYIDKLED